MGRKSARKDGSAVGSEDGPGCGGDRVRCILKEGQRHDGPCVSNVRSPSCRSKRGEKRTESPAIVTAQSGNRPVSASCRAFRRVSLTDMDRRIGQTPRRAPSPDHRVSDVRHRHPPTNGDHDRGPGLFTWRAGRHVLRARLNPRQGPPASHRPPVPLSPLRWQPSASASPRQAQPSTHPAPVQTSSPRTVILFTTQVSPLLARSNQAAPPSSWLDKTGEKGA